MKIDIDIINYIILGFLDDCSALKFLRTNRQLYKKIKKYLYKGDCKLQKIIKRQYTINFKIQKIYVYNLPAEIVNFEDQITHLTFHNIVSGKIKDIDIDCLSNCKKLTHLTFSGLFNQKVDNLPDSLTHLKFGSCFNQKVDHLPSNLVSASFGNFFNQEINNIPKSLKFLKLGVYYYGKIPYLPLLEELFFLGIYLDIEKFSPSLKSLRFYRHNLINRDEIKEILDTHQKVYNKNIEFVGL